MIHNLTEIIFKVGKVTDFCDKKTQGRNYLWKEGNLLRNYVPLPHPCQVKISKKGTEKVATGEVYRFTLYKKNDFRFHYFLVHPISLRKIFSVYVK